MTLKEILNNIDKVLNNSKSECENKLVSTLDKHFEIQKLIESAAPHFDSQETTKQDTCNH